MSKLATTVVIETRLAYPQKLPTKKVAFTSGKGQLIEEKVYYTDKNGVNLPTKND